ncbi:hypothetical protein [Haloarchaeobius sp. TZWSO28]|uniref:hypothetical protein n=1 Tax=Haloarchaeobius sp. TZWSO28 TaxID=3446119 RepID=UPI003EBCEB21
MPPNPNHIDEETVTDDGVHIFTFTNGAASIGRDRDDASEGVWLNRQDKRAVYEHLREHYEGEE